MEPTCEYLDCQVCDTPCYTENVEVPRENAMIKLTGTAALFTASLALGMSGTGSKSDERCRGARK